MTIKCDKISKDEMLQSIKLGVKEAIHEMMETGDGYTGLIIRDIVLGEFKKAVTEGVIDAMPSSFSIEECIGKAISDSMPYGSEILNAIRGGTALGVSGQ